MKKVHLLSALLAPIFLAGCYKDDNYTPAESPAVASTVITGTGDISAKLDEFRTLLGFTLNNTPGSTGGHREVNWDGVPALLSNNNLFPPDFFNSTDPAVANGRKRGIVYIGTSFRVDSTNFAEIDADYATEFTPFSPKRLFAAANSNVTELVFKIPGTNTDATVKGFGAIFTDVDDASSSWIEFFNGNKSLGSFKVPVKNGSNFSFLGVHFPTEKITRIKIWAGNAALAPGVKDISNGGSKDLVVMDDFLYDEPVAD